ncbi:MAG TPA: hydrogenase/urease maturation nickel metallochaperone HypA [Dehalococcoidia bacterium]|nr:hydrogenase/urease maturation nickel metallochaperone HypA [Dehalococcoidia bacterium]
MHESGLARDIVRRAVREAEGCRGARVLALHIVMGTETYVDREALALGIDAASQGTLAEGATVHFTEGSGSGVVLESIQVGEV